MTETQLKKGDRARLIVEGTVYSANPSGEHGERGLAVTVEYLAEDGSPASAVVLLGASAVTVEHIAPTEWPPQAGDLWRDKSGDLWFFHAHQNDTKQIIGRTADGLRWEREHRQSDFSSLLDTCAPWSLVHRDPAEDV